MSRKKPMERPSLPAAPAASVTSSADTNSPRTSPSTTTSRLKTFVEGHALSILLSVIITTAGITAATVGYLLQATNKVEVSRLELELDKARREWEHVRHTLLTAEGAFDLEKIRIDENEVPRYLRDGFQPLPKMDGVLVKFPAEPATEPEYISEYDYVGRQWGKDWESNLSALVSTYGWDMVNDLIADGKTREEGATRFLELANSLRNSFLYIWEIDDAMIVVLEDHESEQQKIKLRTYLMIHRMPLGDLIREGMSTVLSDSRDTKVSRGNVPDWVTRPFKEQPHIEFLRSSFERPLDIMSWFRDSNYRMTHMEATRQFGHIRGLMIHRNVEIPGTAGPQTVYREKVTLVVRPDHRDLVLIEAEGPSVGASSHSLWIDDCLRNIKVVSLN